MRLQDLNWDGKQAAGFQHDCNAHYLCLATSQTTITVPVKAGASYRWWVHQPGGEAVGAAFTVSQGATAPPTAASPDTPQIISPDNGTVVDTATVTLTFQPVAGYTGRYYVRLHDLNWDGTQAPGFHHDATAHYLCVITSSTSITVPVKAGASYKWWVHKPTGTADVAAFTVSADVTTPTPVESPDTPQIVSPQNNTVVDTSSVTLRFNPVPSYTGQYLVRLHDLNWDGKQAPGFQHDSNAHYLCLATKQTSITVPVKPARHTSGGSTNPTAGQWWLPSPSRPTYRRPAPALTHPKVLSPLPGDEITSGTVTLRFQPVAGYTGSYYVRLRDEHWDGKQAPGFQHDSDTHYLCLATKQTSITVPVKPGASYSWWVHTPTSQADGGRFTVARQVGLPVAPNPDEIQPPELIDGRYVCTSFTAWAGKNIDVSGALQYCIDNTPVGATLEIPAGKYYLNHQVKIDRRITITSAGKLITDPGCTESSNDCAELIASAALNEPGGMLLITDIEALHHIIINGNKSVRYSTRAAQYCSSMIDNRYGFNATLTADEAEIVGNVFKNALGGTGLVVKGGRHDLVIRNNLFANNGVHNREGLWADGLTVINISNLRIEGNRFHDNSDIDLILGGAVNSIVTGNEITHSSSPGTGSFAGLMLQKWATSSGNYIGSVISNNVIDGGPGRSIGSGIYLGSEGWYDETPYGSTVPGTASALVSNNVVRNVQNGMYIAAEGFNVYGNSYANAHGGSIRTKIGYVQSVSPIVVSPITRWMNYNGEEVNPLTRGWFTYASWRGHIPNWCCEFCP